MGWHVLQVTKITAASVPSFDAVREKVGLPPREGAKPKAEPGKSGGDRPVGQTQVVQSGPHKGKTVEWDGKGWRLK